MPMSNKTKQRLKDRILTRIIHEGTCWYWASPNNYGYPVTKVNGKRIVVRRLVYLLFKEPLLNLGSKVIRNTCKNPQCINPDHLVLSIKCNPHAKTVLV